MLTHQRETEGKALGRCGQESAGEGRGDVFKQQEDQDVRFVRSEMKGLMVRVMVSGYVSIRVNVRLTWCLGALVSMTCILY